MCIRVQIGVGKGNAARRFADGTRKHEAAGNQRVAAQKDTIARRQVREAVEQPGGIALSQHYGTFSGGSRSIVAGLSQDLSLFWRDKGQ
jgi:hypothetical protein